MRKIAQLLPLLLLLVAAVSCTPQEPALSNPEVSYSGTIHVYKGESTNPNFTTKDAHFDIALDTLDHTAEVVMREVKFATMMPPQTMAVRELPYTINSQGEVVIEEQEVLPYIGSRPYEKYIFPTLKVVLSADQEQMTTHFTCMEYRVEHTGVAVVEE